MLYYDRIEVSKGFDVNKTNVPKECIICLICHYWCFIDKGLSFNHLCVMFAMMHHWCFRALSILLY